MADGEVRRLEPQERERVAAAEWAICVATFYGDLAERLTNGAFEGFTEMGAGAGSIQTFEVPGAFELPLAAKLCADSGKLRRRRLPRRRHPRRDRPLRLRLRRGGERPAPGHARQRHPLLVRGDHLRHPRAGRGPGRRRQARSGSQRRDRRGADAPDGARRPPRLTARSAGSLPCRVRWPRYVTAAARSPRSGTRAATRWSRPAAASTRTCRRCGSTRARARAASTSARAASRPTRSPRPPRRSLTLRISASGSVRHRLTGLARE